MFKNLICVFDFDTTTANYCKSDFKTHLRCFCGFKRERESPISWRKILWTHWLIRPTTIVLNLLYPIVPLEMPVVVMRWLATIRHTSGLKSEKKSMCREVFLKKRIFVQSWSSFITCKFVCKLHYFTNFKS